MSTYLPALHDRWGADQADLKHRVAVLEQQIARLVTGAISCTSTTRPANPAPGTEIYETDTTRVLVWTGSAWQQVTYTPLVCTSTTRPSATFTGMTILETDTGRIRVWSGSAWLFTNSPPSFRMYQTVAQTVASGSDTQITCDSDASPTGWDTDGGRSGSTPWSYTIPSGAGGKWTFSFCICWTASGSGTRWTFLKQNGSTVTGSRFQIPGGSDPVSTGGSCSVVVAAGDVISLWGGQTSGGSLNTANFNASFLEGRLVP